MGTARTVAEQAYAAMEAGDLAGLASLCSANCELNEMGNAIRGPEQIQAYLSAYWAAFPDMRLEVRRLVEDGDSVATEVRFTGTHTGPLAMPTGELPPTGRKLDMDAADFLTIQDGQISNWRVYIDGMTFMRQLGVLPEPATASA
jgi:steroid delta-isomerase-like uncharacterized protein